ncbi:MAG: helix-turn-helix transcriptional regulator [Bacteroidota bacterium]
MSTKRLELNCIRAVLNEQGRTQTWLAKKLDLTFATVNAWCNNRSQPYLTDLVKAAEVLEVAPADLIVDGTKKEKGPKPKLQSLSNYA